MEVKGGTALLVEMAVKAEWDPMTGQAAKAVKAVRASMEEKAARVERVRNLFYINFICKVYGLTVRKR
jgi:hypothetical protein